MQEAYDRGEKKSSKQRNVAANNALRKMLGIKQQFRDIKELGPPREKAS